MLIIKIPTYIRENGRENMLNFLEMKLNLLQFNDEERIYKEYYLAKQDPNTLDKFIQDYRENTDDNKLIISELEPGAGYCTEERDMCNFAGNITIKKHNRYTPLINHKHCFFEMIYILEGYAETTLNGETLNMKVGDILIIAPDVPHTIGVYKDDCIVISIYINYNTFKDNFTSQLTEDLVLSQFFSNIFFSDEKNSYILFQAEEDEMLVTLLDYMIWEGLNYSDYSESIMNNLLKAIFGYLLKKHKDNVVVSKSLSTPSTDIVTILNYIQNNFQDISLESLAAHFEYSVSHLSRLIKKQTGTTFAKILQDIKLKKGCSLLTGTNIPIKDITKIIGYESVEYFTRVFKQTYNITPSEYRQKSN